ncbi:MAG: bacterial Ig-like domain-containing protein, partial [Bacilli bacterium]
MVFHDAVEATCTEVGQEAYWECPNCDKIFADADGKEELSEIRIISKLDHDWDTAYLNDENGHWHECKRCGTNSTSEPHTKGSIGEAQEPTCTEDGITAGEKCTICGYVFAEQEVIQKLGHSMTKTEAKAATCLEEGNNAYYTCSRCDKVFRDEEGTQETTIEAETIPALGHDVTEIIIANPPVKTTYKVGERFDPAGMVVKGVCSRCGHIEISDISIEELDEELSKGEQEITIIFGELSTTVSITVFEEEDL